MTLSHFIKAAIAFILFSFILIDCQRCSPERVHSPHDDGVKTYEEFKTSALHSPYSAAIERRQTILGGYSRLSIGITKDSVKKLIGLPDCGTELYGKEDHRYVGSGWEYIFFKNELKLVNEKLDTVIFVYFDPEGKTAWIVPANLEGLQQFGYPGK